MQILALMGLSILLNSVNQETKSNFTELSAISVPEDLKNLKDPAIVAVRKSEKDIHFLPVVINKPQKPEFIPVYSEKFLSDNNNKGKNQVQFFYVDKKPVGLAVITPVKSASPVPENPVPEVKEEEKKKNK